MRHRISLDPTLAAAAAVVLASLAAVGGYFAGRSFPADTAGPTGALADYGGHGGSGTEIAGGGIVEPADLPQFPGDDPLPFAAIAELVAAAAAADVAALPGLLEAWLGPEGPIDRDFAAAVILSRWRELDPEGALRYLLNHPRPGLLNESTLRELVRAAGENDAGAVLALLEQVPDGDLRRHAEHHVVEALTERRPEAAFELLRRRGADEHLYHHVFSRWAQRDLPAATEQALRLDPGELRETALHGILDSLLDNGTPDEAFGWAESLDDPLLQRRATEVILHMLTDRDPPVAAAHLDRLAQVERREDFARELVHRWSREDPRAALDWAERSLQGLTRMRAINEALENLADEPGGFALNYLADLPLGDIRNEAYERFAFRWGERDLRAARAWVESLPADPTSVPALHGLAAVWSERDPEAAANYADTLDPALQVAFAEVVARNWAESDPAAALSWSDRLTGRAQREARAGALRTWSELDGPAAAAAFGQLDPGPGGDAVEGVAGELAGHWARNDPEGAAAWAGSLAGTESGRRAVAEVAEVWTRVDLESAALWINELPAGEGRDHAVGSLLDKIWDSDPEGAVEWAATLQDHGRRVDALEHIFREWNAQDPAASQQKFSQLGLSGEEFSHVQEALGLAPGPQNDTPIQPPPPAEPNPTSDPPPGS